MTCPCQYPDPKPVLNDYSQVVDIYCAFCGGSMPDHDRRAWVTDAWCSQCKMVLKLIRQGLRYFKSCCGVEFPVDPKTAIALLPVGKS